MHCSVLGDLERGVVLVAARFTDNGHGTVTDNQTGLICLKDANCFGENTWSQALSDCSSLAHGFLRAVGQFYSR